jgi:hypothetical protein
MFLARPRPSALMRTHGWSRPPPAQGRSRLGTCSAQRRLHFVPVATLEAFEGDARTAGPTALRLRSVPAALQIRPPLWAAARQRSGALLLLARPRTTSRRRHGGFGFAVFIRALRRLARHQQLKHEAGFYLVRKALTAPRPETSPPRGTGFRIQCIRACQRPPLRWDSTLSA